MLGWMLLCHNTGGWKNDLCVIIHEVMNECFVLPVKDLVKKSKVVFIIFAQIPVTGDIFQVRGEA